MHRSLRKLKKHIKTTAYARYFAEKRYRRLNNSSLFSLSVSSFSLIFITILEKYSTPNLFSPDTLSMFELLYSIFIAALSLVVSFAAYSTKSEKMFSNANNLNKLVSDIDLGLSIKNKNKRYLKEHQIRESYNQLKLQCENHLPLDYFFGKAEKKRVEGKTPEPLTIRKCFFYIELWIPILSFWLISTVSISIFGYALYRYFSC